MNCCLAQLGTLEVEAEDEFTDDECLIRPEWMAKAVEQLRPLVRPAQSPESILERLGWVRA